MNAAETAALATVKALAARNSIRFSTHGGERGSERNIGHRNARSALMTATVIVAQANGAWRVSGGHDTDGDMIVVVCLIENQVVIVTVHGG